MISSLILHNCIFHRCLLIWIFGAFWEPNITHGREHLLLSRRHILAIINHIGCRWINHIRSFEYRVIVPILTAEILLGNFEFTKVGCDIANLLLLLIVFVQFLNLFQLIITNVNVFSAGLVFISVCVRWMLWGPVHIEFPYALLSSSVG